MTPNGTKMRRLKRSIRKTTRRNSKSTYLKEKVAVSMDSHMVRSDEDVIIPKNSSFPQDTSRRSSSFRVTKAKSLCYGQLQGEGLSFHRVDGDLVHTGLLTNNDCRKMVEISCVEGILDKKNLSDKTNHVGEDTTRTESLTVSSSWGSQSFSTYSEAIFLDELSGVPLQLISPTTTVFIRATDLDTTPFDQLQNESGNESTSAALYPYLYSPSPHPNLSLCKKDRWIAVNDINNTHSSNNKNSVSSPVLRQSVSKIFQRGLELISNESLWVRDKKTDRYLKAHSSKRSHDMSVPSSPLGQSNLLDAEEVQKDIVLAWSASIGSHICTRVEGMIELGPEWLYDLLLDSSRVKEFNKLSLGREDVWVMEKEGSSNGGFKEVTKVIRGKNKAPLVSKPIVFHNLMHGRELEGGAGYAIVTRTARLVEDGCDGSSEPQQLSELYTGMMLILKIEGANNRCVMINASEFTSPLPAMITKKYGVAGAVTMIEDIRKLNCVSRSPLIEEQ